MPNSKRSNEILIAVLGLVGVLATGVLSNWDKLFAKNPIVQAQYTGYKPTGDFETEVRYLMEVSGTRATMDSYLKNYIESEKMELISKRPSDAGAINRVFDILSQEFKFDDIVTAVLPIYQKHYTLAQIQELNKFYSTDSMRQMVREGPLMTKEFIPVQNKLIADLQTRLNERLRSMD